MPVEFAVLTAVPVSVVKKATSPFASTAGSSKDLKLTPLRPGTVAPVCARKSSSKPLEPERKVAMLVVAVDSSVPKRRGSR